MKSLTKVFAVLFALFVLNMNVNASEIYCTYEFPTDFKAADSTALERIKILQGAKVELEIDLENKEAYWNGTSIKKRIKLSDINSNYTEKEFVQFQSTSFSYFNTLYENSNNSCPTTITFGWESETWVFLGGKTTNIENGTCQSDSIDKCISLSLVKEEEDILATSKEYKVYNSFLQRNTSIVFFVKSDGKTFVTIDDVDYEAQGLNVAPSGGNSYLGSYHFILEDEDYDEIFATGPSGEYSFPEEIYLAKNNTEVYITANKNKADSEIISSDPIDEDQHGFQPNEICGENGENCDINLNGFCGEPTVSRVLKFIGLIIFIAKILVPAIIIIMGFVTLFKIMTSGKVDEAKKQVNNIIRNIVIGVLIFLLPSLINLVFEMADDIISPGETSDFSNCVNCLTTPNDSSKCIIDESDD